jgi:hypothetical protein
MIEGERPASLNAYKVHWFLTDMMFFRIMVHTYKKKEGGNADEIEATA